MNLNNPEEQASQELWSNILDQKKQYSDKIPGFYTLIVSLSAVLLSVLATNESLATQEPYAVLLFQATIVFLLLNVVFGVVALYGRINIHNDKVKNICQEVDNHEGSCSGALEKMRKEPLIFQPKIYAWSNRLCFWCFLISQILLAWFAITTV